VLGSSACVHMDSQLQPATGAGKCAHCRELVVLREEMVGNEGSSASPHSVCLHRRRSKLPLWKSVMQRQEPACSQLPRKLKRSLSFAADYFNLHGIRSLHKHCEAGEAEGTAQSARVMRTVQKEARQTTAVLETQSQV